jgi:hypothetical protein
MDANKNVESNQEQANSFSVIENQHRGPTHDHNVEWASSTSSTSSYSYNDEYKSHN